MRNSLQLVRQLALNALPSVSSGSSSALPCLLTRTRLFEMLLLLVARFYDKMPTSDLPLLKLMMKFLFGALLFVYTLASVLYTAPHLRSVTCLASATS